MRSHRRWSCSVCHKSFLHEFQVVCHFKQRRSRCYQAPISAIALGPSLNRKPLYAQQGLPVPVVDSTILDAPADNDTYHTVTGPAADLHALSRGSQVVVVPYLGASEVFKSGTSFLNDFDADQFAPRRQENLFYPFGSEDEYHMGSFLLRSGMSMVSLDEFFKLNLVSGQFLQQKVQNSYICI